MVLKFVLKNALFLCILQFAQVDPAKSTPPKDEPSKKFITLLETPFSIYSLSLSSEDPLTADHICREHNGHLVALNNAEDSKAIYKKLEDFSADYDLIWTSGIIYSNASVEDLLLWNSTREPINQTYANFNFLIPSRENGNAAAAYIRNRREIISVDTGEGSKDDDCDCDCSTTPAPFTRPPCRKPSCHINIPNPPCQEVKPRECNLTGLPECTVKQVNCTVECKEECRVIQQPKCTIKSSSKPRCQLKQPDPCDTVTPNCTIVSPGVCRSVQDKCEQDEGTCKPIIKPCKNPCTLPECQTTQPPCITTQLPCAPSPPVSCPVTPSNPECKIQNTSCRVKRASNGVGNNTLLCDSFEICPKSSKPIPIAPIECSSNVPIECPTIETCPPPVTSCSRPFVDCSPEICQSSVQICLAPNIRCPVPRIICESPVVKCDTVENCPTNPEVECGEPELECTKAKVECPDAIVHCNPAITSCGQAPVSCSEPEMSCQSPDISCEEPVTCPPDGAEGEPYSNCEKCRGKKCSGKQKAKSKGRKSGRKDALMLPGEIEFVEKTSCIALKNDVGFKWVMQSCSVKHKFLCQRHKKKKEASKGLAGLLDFVL